MRLLRSRLVRIGLRLVFHLCTSLDQFCFTLSVGLYCIRRTFARFSVA